LRGKCGWDGIGLGGKNGMGGMKRKERPPRPFSMQHLGAAAADEEGKNGKGKEREGGRTKEEELAGPTMWI